MSPHWKIILFFIQSCSTCHRCPPQVIYLLGWLYERNNNIHWMVMSVSMWEYEWIFMCVFVWYEQFGINYEYDENTNMTIWKFSQYTGHISKPRCALLFRRQYLILPTHFEDLWFVNWWNLLKTIKSTIKVSFKEIVELQYHQISVSTPLYIYIYIYRYRLKWIFMRRIFCFDCMRRHIRP